MATVAMTYPKISKRIWFLLRDRLKKTIPSVISTTYVVATSPMEEASARSNVIKPLRELGLVDDKDVPTALASRWRHDDEYAAVCHEIRQTVYPQNLIEAFPNVDSNNKDAIKNWFMKTGKVGEAAARMYTETYVLLSQASLEQVEERTSTKAATRKSTTGAKVIKAAPTLKPAQQEVPPAQQAPEHNAHKRFPAIHIDVQVHISPDTSPEQIDRIFESMSKHLGSHIK